MLKLNFSQVQTLGARDECYTLVDLKRTSIKCVHYTNPYFTCCTYEWKMKGYKRYIGWSSQAYSYELEDQKITKSNNGNGFFPTLAGNEVEITTTYIREFDFYLAKLKKKIPNLVIYKLDDGYHLKFPTDENSIYEFDFMPHNNGVYISKLTKI